MRSKTIILAVLAFFAVTAISGCQYLKKRVLKTEKAEYKLNAAGKTRIEIDNLNGDLDVIAIEDTLNTIYIMAEIRDRVRIGEQDKPIEGIEIKIDSSGNVIKVNTEYKHFGTFLGDKSEAKVKYIIKVPSKLQVYVTLTNGKINANNLQSDSKFENVNGSIYLGKCSGDIKLETVNGSIKANIDSTKGINAETVNGSITIGNLKLVNANVDASCDNGKVKYENISFSSLSSEKKNLSGMLGSGGSIIKLTTVNGSIKLDGNPVNINKKEHADFDIKFEFDDNDEPVKIETKHTNEQKGVESDTTKAKDSSRVK